MTQEEQCEFVKRLSENVLFGIEQSIKEHRIPESWDGIELRQYLADKFAYATMSMSLKRRREYNNYILVNNL